MQTVVKILQLQTFITPKIHVIEVSNKVYIKNNYCLVGLITFWSLFEKIFFVVD